MLAEPALDVPALVIERLGEAVAHGASVRRLGPAAAGVAAIEAKDGLPDAQFFSAEAVIVLGVVASIAEGGIDRDQFRGLAHGRGEVRGVLARADTRHGAEQEVRASVEHDGELGPGPLPVTLSLGSPLAKVGTDMPGLEAGRVHGGHWRGVDQALTARPSDQGRLSPDESPPASASARMRREACASVE